MVILGCGIFHIQQIFVEASFAEQVDFLQVSILYFSDPYTWTAQTHHESSRRIDIPVPKGQRKPEQSAGP